MMPRNVFTVKIYNIDQGHKSENSKSTMNIHILTDI